MNNRLEAARDFRRRGWQPVPVPPGEKGSKLSGWDKLRLSLDELPCYFGEDCNIGVILGPASGELVDGDLDCAEAMSLADIYLPSTGAIFGRASKPRSHWLYVSPGASYANFADPTTGETLLELRARGAAGGEHQTLLPPSIADGERRVWCGDTIAPAGYEAAKLRRRCAFLAMACLLDRYVSNTAARKPGPDFPRLLWEFDRALGRVAYRWLGEPDPDAPKAHPKPKRDLSRAEINLAEVVHAIPNHCDWHEWNRIGLAIYSASGGSDHGGIIFDDWSAKSPKYNPYETSARWRHYHRSPPDRIGVGTLIHLAREAGWRPTSERAT
jgi:hypothetical protein